MIANVSLNSKRASIPFGMIGAKEHDFSNKHCLGIVNTFQYILLVPERLRVLNPVVFFFCRQNLQALIG